MNATWYCSVCHKPTVGGIEFAVYLGLGGRTNKACADCWRKLAHCQHCGSPLPIANGGLCLDCIERENQWAWDEGLLEFHLEDGDE